MITYFFDFIIIAILLYCLYWMYWVVHSFFYHRKLHLWKLQLFLICAVVFGAVFYGSFVEPRLLIEKTISLNFGKTDQHENIKVVFLTDLHLGRYKKDGFLNKVTDKVLAQKPDLILLGGDFILNKESDARYLSPLSRLQGITTYAVLGNHEFNLGSYDLRRYKDKTVQLRQLFSKLNIKILENGNEVIDIDGQKLALLGVADLFAGQDDLKQAKQGIDADMPTILLSHNPDIILNNESKSIDLILSGHTHAGQIRLPYLGSIPKIPDKLGRAYDSGLFNLDGNYLYISAGLAESGVRARLFNRPEITVLNIDL